MKNLLLTTAVLVGLAMLGTGCYTQIGTTSDRPEPEPAYSDQENPQSSDEQYDQYAEDDQYRRDALYWDYYYPSTTIMYGYTPWRWNYRWGYAYSDPFFYSSYYPWGWCGTSYPILYTGWWAPVYDPWYGGGYGYGYGWSGGGGGYSGGTYGHGSTRTVGVTRTTGDTRNGGGRTSYGGAGGGSLPTGYSTGTSRTPQQETVRQPARGSRVSSGRSGSESGRSSEAAPARSGRTRSGGGRSSDVRTPSRAPSYTPPPPRSSGGNSGSSSEPTRSTGGRSEGGRSYSPPAQSSPPPSSPPPSSPPPSNGEGRNSGGRGR